ncbi:hypothetical protein DFH07DRAFT_953189 [Mycena maculata]|uniref:Uncharacterized protein n=1 Tax=Mycena maculata TaxID=230809 RepID=A0AAD7JVP5_9AGAR|nr:hypothetical protein DFH07DRAFT_953189 [Mycena maculata]
MPKTADDASDSDGETVIASPVPYPKAKCEPVLSTLSSTPFSPPFTQLSRPPVLTAQLVLPGPSTNVAGAPRIIGCLCVAARVTAQCPDVLAHGPAATHAADERIDPENDMYATQDVSASLWGQADASVAKLEVVASSEWQNGTDALGVGLIRNGSDAGREQMAGDIRILDEWK